jgi:endonuclease YncB( thermonuclease family)
MAKETAELHTLFPLDKKTGLAAIEGCTLVPTDWADGDSFRIRTPDGTEFTVRLYGVDCIELHVSDKTDADRLRSQRRYFGMAGTDTAASVARAKSFAAMAAQRTLELLAKPFTVHSAFSDGKGDGRYSRVYAFVTTSTGRDLSEILVAEGLARAFGVSRMTPLGESRDEYSARLSDVELATAKRGAGAWAGTIWERLVEERQDERKEEAEVKIATGDLPPPDQPIDLNLAARDELMSIPGIGETTANRIIEARPFGSVEDLLEVPGIGKLTLEKLRSFFTVSSSL